MDNIKDMCKGVTKEYGGSTVYGFGFIGALVYFLSNATTFWMGVVGFLKALVWPAFLVYHLFEFLLK